MQLILYQNTAENIRVDKTQNLKQVLSLEGTLRDECSIIEPTITVQLTELPQFNYAYITEFGRYYFLKGITSIRNNLWNIELSVDVTMSFKEVIKSLRAVVNRNQFDFNKELFDDRLPISNVPTWTIEKKDHGLFFPFKGYVKIFVGIVKQSYLSNYIDKDAEDFELGCIPSSGCSPLDKTVSVYIWDDMDLFNDFIWEVGKDSALTSQVVFIRIIPCSDIFTIGTANSGNDIHKVTGVIFSGQDGNPITIKTDAYLFSGGANPHYSVEIQIDRQFNDFRDYSPYTEYELYIPMYGWVQLDSTKVIGKNIVIFTSMDITNGEAQTTVFIGSTKTDPNNEKVDIPTNVSDIITTVSYSIGSQLPITYTGSADAIRQAEANITRKNGNDLAIALQSIGKIADIGLSGISRVATNPLSAISVSGDIASATTGAFANLARNDAEYRANQILNVSKGGSTGSTSVYNSFHSGFYYYIRTYTYLATVNITEYAKYAGRPLNEIREVSSLHGYTELGEVFVHDFGNATGIEISFIKECLRSGIIL